MILRPTLTIDSPMEEFDVAAPIVESWCMKSRGGLRWAAKLLSNYLEGDKIHKEAVMIQTLMEADFSLPHNLLLRRGCGFWSAVCYRSHPEFRLAQFPIHPQFSPPPKAPAGLQTSTISTPFASYATTEQPQPRAVPRLLLPRSPLPPSLPLCAPRSSAKYLKILLLRMRTSSSPSMVHKNWDFEKIWLSIAGLCKHERFWFHCQLSEWLFVERFYIISGLRSIFPSSRITPFSHHFWSLASVNRWHCELRNCWGMPKRKNVCF